MREKIVEEALTWLKTPYHHRGNVKGAGVDCAFFLIEVYAAVGLIERFDPGYYPMDIMMHRGEETYLAWVEKFGKLVDAPKPGDIAVWKFGRIFSHGAIVIDWPNIIHAHRTERGVVLARGDDGERAGREVKFYSLWSGD